MFKVMALLLATTCLTGCMSLNERGITQEREIRGKTEGSSCSFLDENGRLRACIDKKYHHNDPQGYQLGVLENGTPVAVMDESEGQSIRVYPSLDAKKEVVAPKKETKTSVKAVEEVAEDDNPWVLQEEIKTPETVLAVPQAKTQTQVKSVTNTIESQTQAVPVVNKVQKTEDKWWDVSTTKENEQTPRIFRAEPVCPCADPNAPCPECNDK